MALIDLTPQISIDGPVFPLHGVLVFIDLKDINGNPIDDTSLILNIQDEGHGTIIIANATLTHPSVGRYEFIHCAAAAGKTNGHWRSTVATKISLHFFYRVCHTQILAHKIHTHDAGALGQGVGGSVPAIV